MAALFHHTSFSLVLASRRHALPNALKGMAIRCVQTSPPFRARRETHERIFRYNIFSQRGEEINLPTCDSLHRELPQKANLQPALQVGVWNVEICKAYPDNEAHSDSKNAPNCGGDTDKVVISHKLPTLFHQSHSEDVGLQYRRTLSTHFGT